MLADSLEHLVRGIVDHPDDVAVRSRSSQRGTTLEVRVHPDDLGRVIGRAGRTAKALRTVINSLAGRESGRVDLIACRTSPSCIHRRGGARVGADATARSESAWYGSIHAMRIGTERVQPQRVPAGELH